MPILQTSCAQQRLHATDGEFPWEIFDDKNNKLFELPRELSLEQISAIRKFAKKFEKIAYEEGISETQEALAKDYKDREVLWQHNFEALKFENERLSSALNKLAGAAEEDDKDEQSKIGIPEHML